MASSAANSQSVFAGRLEIRGIEFVESFAQLGEGQGGYNQDHEFYGYRVPI